MKLNSLKHKAKNFISVLLMSILALFTNSCDSLHEDLQPCPQGLRLRFIYEYNMLFANAFMSQVHCLTLLVYDENGNYMDTVTVTDRELLADENWRMILDLPAGDYTLIAYGGMACPDASFVFDPTPGTGVEMSQVEVTMKPEFITSPENNPMHDLFYGMLKVTVPENGTDYTDATVEMMKDTNNLRIILQHLDNTPVKVDDFNFEVIADNTKFNYENDVIPTEMTIFRPWITGQEPIGAEIVGDHVQDVVSEIAYAEISLSRLMLNGGSRLEITLASDGDSVVSIPLAIYLQYLKSQRYASMGPQEFLDRESEWTLFFFLDKKNRWVKTQIIINGWVVRINDIEGWF